MKKRLVVSVILVLLFVLTSCAPKAGSEEVEEAAPAEEMEEESSAAVEEEAVQETFTVAISVNSLDTYQTQMTDFLEEELAAMGGTLVVYNPDGVMEKQLADVETMIQTEPDVIVIQPVDPDGSVTAVQAAHNAGIPTVVYQLAFNGTEDDYDAMIAREDSEIRGKVQADWIKAWLDEHPDEELFVGSLMGTPAGGNYGYKGFTHIYEDPAYSDRITEVIAANAQWTRDEAIRIVEDWLVAHPEINVFQAENDEMALGAVNAINAAGKDISNYLTLGQNGDPNAQESIYNGELSMSASNSKREQARICAEVCRDLASGVTWEGDAKFHPTDASYLYAMDISTIDDLLATGLFD
jgi:ABC-type sugar transport system substrate-binding protein